MLSGLNLTVYTATIGGTINTVETLGVFTSKVAELQVVGPMDGSNLGLGSLGAGVGLLLTLLLLLLLLVVRVRVRSASSSEENGLNVEVRPVVRGTKEEEVAYTVYDKVDLLSPASEVGEERYDEYLTSTPSCQRLPPPPPCRGRSEGDGGGHHGHPPPVVVGGNSSVDSLSSLLSHLHHQESVL